MVFTSQPPRSSPNDRGGCFPFTHIYMPHTTLSREQIRAATPDQLNTWTATEVMGWHHTEGLGTKAAVWLGQDGHYRGHVLDDATRNWPRGDLWCPAEDWNDAMDCAGEIATVQARSDFNLSYTAAFPHSGDTKTGGNWLVYFPGPTDARSVFWADGPAAVCRACLNVLVADREFAQSQGV